MRTKFISMAAVFTALAVLATAAPSTAATTIDRDLKAGLDRITAAGMPGAFAEVRSPTARAASGVRCTGPTSPARPRTSSAPTPRPTSLGTTAN